MAEDVPTQGPIEQAAALLAAVVASSSDAILSKTLDGRITSWNAASEQLFGFSATEMNDQSVFRLIPEYLHDEEVDLLRRVGTGEHIDRYETIRVNKAGKLLNVSVTLSPVRDGDGQISGASTIIRDMSEQQRANEAEALLAAIVKSSYDPIVSKDLNGIVSSWNAAAETVFGFSPDEMIGQSIRKIIPADLQGEEDNILKRLATGEAITNFETERQHKDGTIFPVTITVSPVIKGSEILGASKILRDITEEKQARERSVMLMHEIEHRAKNLLALVQAIARRTVATSPEQFLNRFVQRIDSLIANQDNLIASGWQGADLVNLVRAQLAIFGDAIGTRIKIEGPNLILSPPAAQAIGMAIHELATNASKHGALSVQSGSVKVGWFVDAENFSMAWREQGGPPVSPPTREGFGSKVLQELTELAVDGKVDLSFAPQGFSWMLCCPTDAIIRNANTVPKHFNQPDRHES